MSWSASQYSKFEDERNRPIRDLLAQVLNERVEHAADIGCGPGNSTQFLREKFPGAAIVGMDSSENMLEAARKRLPDVRFEAGDIATWSEPGPFDVILSNAALQWVPDHAALLPTLLAKLAPGGSLAVQMPDNLDEPAHRLMREMAADGPWASKLTNASRARDSRHGADWYYRVLREQGADVNVWRTIYHHPLAGGAAAIVEWFKGSGLRPFLDPLDEGERVAYLARYEAALAKEYSLFPDGAALLPFPRLFFVATRR
jgi:trans-aconitate 2-methyltransferase